MVKSVASTLKNEEKLKVVYCTIKHSVSVADKTTDVRQRAFRVTHRRRKRK